MAKKNKGVTVKRRSHMLAADELINAITEVLILASGEEIAEAAKQAGLDVEYLGDSMYRVYEE